MGNDFESEYEWRGYTYCMSISEQIKEGYCVGLKNDGREIALVWKNDWVVILPCNIPVFTDRRVILREGNYPTILYLT